MGGKQRGRKGERQRERVRSRRAWRRFGSGQTEGQEETQLHSLMPTGLLPPPPSTRPRWAARDTTGKSCQHVCPEAHVFSCVSIHPRPSPSLLEPRRVCGPCLPLSRGAGVEWEWDPRGSGLGRTHRNADSSPDAQSLECHPPGSTRPQRIMKHPWITGETKGI